MLLTYRDSFFHRKVEPQLFLGITFNYGLILGWTSIFGEISFIPVIFYLGAIFWTLAYDTIYGFQDIKDDEIIGLKSTSIKFKKIPYLFLTLCYLIFFISLITVGLLMSLNNLFFVDTINLLAASTATVAAITATIDDAVACVVVTMSLVPPLLL